MTTTTIVGLAALAASVHAFHATDAAAQNQKQKPAIAGTPSVSLADFDPVAADKLNRTRLRNLERVIQATSSSAAEMPDLLFSLATLHWQDHRYWSELGKTASAPGSKPSAQHSKQASLAAHSALKTLAQLAADHPNYARSDEALYGLARLSAATGSLVGARRSFMQLIRNHPRSKLIPNAYASFGDHYAEQNNRAHAARFYNKVLEFPKSTVFPYGLYRTAWIKIEEGQASRALQLLVRVVKSPQTATVPALGRAARADIVQLYAAVGKAAKAGAFFRRIDSAGAGAMLHDLADTYARQGLSDQAISVRQQALSQDPGKKPRR